MRISYVSTVLALIIIGTTSADADSVGGWHLIGNDPAAFVSAGSSSIVQSGEAAMAMGATSHPEMAVTEAIRSQAKALGNDPVKIFEYVRNHVGFELYFGCLKGAEGTLLSGYGNDIDQCALLGALLSAADETISIEYIQGNVVYAGEFLSDLFNLPEGSLPHLNPWFLINPPIQRYDGWEIDKHYWLQVVINGSTYQLDPSFVPHKKNVTNAESHLVAATGYDRQDLLDAASDGATLFDTNQVQGVNESELENMLDGYVASLIDADEAHDVLEKLVRQPEPKREILTELVTGSPPDMVRVVSSSILDVLPETLFGRFTLKFDEWNSVSLDGYDLAGQRLTLFHDTSDYNRPVLRLNGSEVYRGGGSYVIGNVSDLEIKVSLPTGWGIAYEHAESVSMTVGSSYGVVSDFLVSSPKVLARESKKLSEYRDQGLSDDSEEVLGTALHIMGLTYTRQNTLQNKLLGRMAGIPALGIYQPKCGKGNLALMLQVAYRQQDECI